MRNFITTVIAVVFFTAFALGQRVAVKQHSAPKPNIVKGELSKSTKGGIIESFEGDFLSSGWTLINPLGGPGWQAIKGGAKIPGWQNSIASVPEGGGNKVVYVTWNSSGCTDYSQGLPTDEWLVSPQYKVKEGDELTFQIIHTGDYLNNVDILLSTTDNTMGSFNITLDNFVFNTTTDWEEKTYDLSAYAGLNVYIAFREHINSTAAEGGIVMLDMIKIGEVDVPDLALTSLDLPSTVAQGTEVQVAGTVFNSGSEVTSFDVTYNINNGTESAVYSVSGVNIPGGTTYDFTHNVPCSFDLEANYTVNVTVSNVNGGEEVNLVDNILSKNIDVYSEALPRTVLLEQFTTERCPNCPPVLGYLEPIVENNADLILMSHHAGYYTDFLTIPESTEMIEFYNAGGAAYAPAGMFDRNYNPAGEEPGPVFWDGEPFGLNKYNERKTVPAFTSVNISGTNNSGELTLKVSGEFVDNVTDDLGVSLWITEDNINAQNQGGASNWVHRYSVRDAISARLGDPITTSTNEGEVFSAEYTYSLNGSWNADEIYLVGFVNKMNATDVNDRDVLNAVQVKLSDLVETIPATAVKLDRDTIKFSVNDTQTLMPKMFPANTTETFTWGSGDENIATVDENGLVTAIAEGSTYVYINKVGKEDKVTDTCQIIVDNEIVNVTGVTVSAESETIEAGATLQLSATIAPTDATIKEVTWLSTNREVAIVNEDGLVTALEPGNVEIIVTTKDQSKKATCLVTVNASVKNVLLNPAVASVEVEETIHLNAVVLPENASNKAVTWTSSDDAIATVDDNGLVTAVTEGEVTITVTTLDGGKTATCALNVAPKTIHVETVSLTPTTGTLDINETLQLTASVTPDNAVNSNVIWSSANNSVATVDEKGLVTAVAKGDVNITATTLDGGKTATCAIHVNGPIGVNELGDLKEMYPNPSTGYVFVEMNETCVVEITNIAGQVIQTKQLNKGKNRLHIKQAGIYFIHFMNDNTNAVKKVVVQ